MTDLRNPSDAPVASGPAQRTVGLLGATSIGVGGIIGGGILALAGVAFATTGPGAIAAFALNGAIAFLTALAFAELATTFPESGGPYTYAKKLLSVEAAFGVGWIVLFASIVASVLYALGFAVYLLMGLERAVHAAGMDPPAWWGHRWLAVGVAGATTAVTGLQLTREGSRGGHWASFGKVVLFALLVASGLWVLAGRPAGTAGAALEPFLPAGTSGLLLAMGTTFIALQGFDLIAAVAGEVRDPDRTLPRAIVGSLSIAIALYLPLLFVVVTVGVEPGQTIRSASLQGPGTAFARAVETFLGTPGFWLVVGAALLSMLSALRANLLAASRIALTMGRDRSLPPWLGRIDPRTRTPILAIAVITLATGAILLAVPDVSTAGSAASLIFLVSFALTHWMSIVARLRAAPREGAFRAPGFPVIPIVGSVLCAALAIFQGVAEPVAGTIAAAWLGTGTVLFVILFARRARIVDAQAQGHDPLLLRMRGQSPLVLVPIANPASAPALVTVANAITPPDVGRVLLLSVVTTPDDWGEGDERPRQLVYAQEVLGEALSASFPLGLSPEALTTIAPHPWREIDRVARVHGCAALVLGLSRISERVEGTALEELLASSDRDTVILRAPGGGRRTRSGGSSCPSAAGGTRTSSGPVSWEAWAGPRGWR